MSHGGRINDHEIFISLNNFLTKGISAMNDNSENDGYNNINTDNPIVVEGLWENALDYSEKTKTIKKPIIEIKHPLIYYTNFEIAKTKWFLEKEYNNFFNFIDNLGGIYYKRWGDAAIKYLGIEMFLEDKYKHNFNDLNYRHGNIFNF